MRSIKTYLFLGLITFTVLSADAQAPGYLGKRFMFNYDIYTMPALANPNVNGNTGISSFNFRQAFSVDYVTGLNKSFGLSFHRTKTQFEFKRGLYYTYQYDNGYGYEQTASENVYYTGTTGELSAFMIGLHTNLYFKQFIAPLGTYFKPEILLVNFRATYDPDEANANLAANTNSYGHTMINYPVLVNKKSYTTVALGATIGTHYIFFDRLVFNIGFQFGWVVGGKKMGEWMDIEASNNNKINEENYIPVSAKSRLMNQYLININAGLGILIF